MVAQCRSTERLAAGVRVGPLLVVLAMVEHRERFDGWIDRSRAAGEQAEPSLRQYARPDELARELNNIGVELKECGDLINAKAKLEEALALGRALGDMMLIHVALSTLADIEFADDRTASGSVPSLT